MINDATLLRRYAHEHSQGAFEELVRRYLDLVYAAAMRRLDGDAHRAADVAQVVFATLAREASSLTRHTVLAGWLYTATRNAALNVLRTEERRRVREQKAYRIQEISSSSDPITDWQQLRPVLDSALDELDERDREAVLLRFFQSRPFVEVALSLQVTEDTARKRVERALEKLRGRLTQRGITSTAAALGVALAAQPVVSAPLGLAATVASTATAGLATLGIAAASHAALTFMSTTKVIVGIASLAAVLGFGIYLGADRFAAPSSDDAILKKEVASLRKENERLKRDVTQLTAEPSSVASNPPPVAVPRPASTPQPMNAATPSVGLTTTQKWNGVRNNLQLIRAAASKFKIEYKRSPMSLDELVGETKYIRRLHPVGDERYQSLDLGNTDGAMSITMENGLVVRMEAVGAPSEPPPFVGAQEQAMARFRAATGGRTPTGAELAAYFEADDFRQEFLFKAKGLAFQQEMGAAMVPEMEKAFMGFQAANGRFPKLWEDVLAVGAFLDNPADRDRLFEVWHRVDAQFKP